MREQPETLRPDEVLGPEGSMLPATRAWVTEAMLLLPNLIKLVGRLLVDRRVPTLAKAFLLVTVGYVLSPIDILPDIIPFLGQLDDLLFICLALHYLLRSVGPPVVLEHWDGSDNLLETITTVVDIGAGLVPRPIKRVLERLIV